MPQEKHSALAPTHNTNLVKTFSKEGENTTLLAAKQHNSRKDLYNLDAF